MGTRSRPTTGTWSARSATRRGALRPPSRAPQGRAAVPGDDPEGGRHRGPGELPQGGDLRRRGRSGRGSDGAGQAAEDLEEPGRGRFEEADGAVSGGSGERCTASLGST